MRPFAVVDLGASALRLAVAESQAGAPPRILEEASRGILLGKDTFTHGRLGAATVEATLKVLEGFRRIMDTYGVVRYRAVATSAIRDATNRDEFLRRADLDVQVLTTEEEAFYGYLAAVNSTTLTDGVALDLGGGSMQLTRVESRAAIDGRSWPLGAVRMTERFMPEGGKAK
ncbi:MAG TPA: exopolyphosphatase, partial [Vicinamibacteria bacterium]